ncbi:hypothetical protein O181_052335 [Austropuccinia psidii MF-1]|uniref:Uncharacterized protein n=1 Tax=Austropuccinia psidii MF-1 TaxID=1389203 RepID=A0A9Q3HSJ9_9BASI|nr:hypothetical protein [Austropuccinia psidii MF-1]
MVSWPYDMFMANCALLAISPFHWPYWPILHLTNPQAIILVFGPVGLFSIPGAYGPWPNPLFYGDFGPFSPPTASTAHSLYAMGPLGPFWPNSYEAKRGQWGSSSAPKARWAHLSQFWPQNPTDPENGQN